MKRVLFIMICLLQFTLTTCCFAKGESVTYIDYRKAIGILTELNNSILTIADTEQDSDTQEILSYVNYQLNLMVSGLNIAVVDDNQLQDYDLFALEDDTDSLEEYFLIQPVYIEELGWGQGYEVRKKNNYSRIERTIYARDLTEVYEYIRIEFAIRPETRERMMLLTLIKYDDLLTSSNRYLVYSDDNTSKSLFRRTFGSDLEYRIDLSLWANGKDYNWDSKLLYPSE